LSAVSGSLTGATIDYNAGSSTTYTFSPGVASTHDYRINSTSANGSVGVAAVTVPGPAGTYVFTLQTRRQVAYGGEGVDWATVGSVNIIRSAAGSAPSINVTNNDPDSPNVTATINLSSSGSGGTLEYSNGGAWQTSPNTFTQARNTTVSYTARRSASLVSNTVDHAVGYKATSTTGTISASPTNPAYTGSTSTITLTIPAENKAAGHNYYVDGVAIGTATSVTKTLAAPAESTATYVLTVVRPTSYGGNGSVVSDGSVTVTRGAAGDSAPSITVADNSNAGTSVTATITLSSEGSGGTGVEYSNGGAWQTSPNTFSQNRNTTVSYTARRSGINLESNTVSHAVGYLTGDTDVEASNDTISSSASSASTTISNGTSGETYAVRVENGSTNLEAGVADAQGAVTISFTSSLPTGTNTTTYEIFVKRPTSTGGDGSTYTATNDTFTVNRQAAGGGGGTAYGLQVRNASDQLVLEVSDRAPRFVSTGSSAYTTGGSAITVTVTGMANDDTWAVVVNSTVPYGGVEVVKGTNSFTMKQTGPAINLAATLRYIVLRT
jgi:hypothetical protein